MVLSMLPLELLTMVIERADSQTQAALRLVNRSFHALLTRLNLPVRETCGLTLFYNTSEDQLSIAKTDGWGGIRWQECDTDERARTRLKVVATQKGRETSDVSQIEAILQSIHLFRISILNNLVINAEFLKALSYNLLVDVREIRIAKCVFAVSEDELCRFFEHVGQTRFMIYTCHGLEKLLTNKSLASLRKVINIDWNNMQCTGSSVTELPLVTDRLLDHWARNPPYDINLRYAMTAFTPMAIRKFIESLTKLQVDRTDYSKTYFLGLVQTSEPLDAIEWPPEYYARHDFRFGHYAARTLFFRTDYAEVIFYLVQTCCPNALLGKCCEHNKRPYILPPVVYVDEIIDVVPIPTTEVEEFCRKCSC